MTTLPLSNGDRQKEKMSKNDWVAGFMCACAITMKNHRCDSIVEDTLACNFMTVKQMRAAGIDEGDIETLRPIIKEHLRKRKLSQ